MEITAAPWYQLYLCPFIFRTRPQLRREENWVDRAVKEPLFSSTHFSFYLFPFSFRASCSHLHAVAVMTKENCSPGKPVVSNSPRFWIPNIYCMCHVGGRARGKGEPGQVTWEGVGPGGIHRNASSQDLHFDTCLLIQSKHLMFTVLRNALFKQIWFLPRAFSSHWPLWT